MKWKSFTIRNDPFLLASFNHPLSKCALLQGAFNYPLIFAVFLEAVSLLIKQVLEIQYNKQSSFINSQANSRKTFQTIDVYLTHGAQKEKSSARNAQTTEPISRNNVVLCHSANK